MDFTIHEVDYILLRQLHLAGHANVLKKVAMRDAGREPRDSRRLWLMWMTVASTQMILPSRLEEIKAKQSFINACRIATDVSTVLTVMQCLLEEEAAALSEAWQPGWSVVRAGGDDSFKEDVIMQIVRYIRESAAQCHAVPGHLRRAADMLGKALAIAATDDSATVVKVITEAYTRQDDYTWT